MEPQRLKGEIFEGKLKGLKYENGILSVGNVKEYSGLTIENLFARVGEKEFGENRDLNEGYFQLGWNSVALFEVSESGFKLTDVEDLMLTKSKKSFPEAYMKALEKLNSFKGKTFTQAVTRAVDTCTFVYLKCGGKVVLAHLDYKYHDDGLTKIKELLNPDENKDVVGICSRTLDENGESTRRNFCEKLKAYGGGVKFYTRNDPADTNHYCGHFEIGVYLDDNSVPELFGDFTDQPAPVFDEKTPSELPKMQTDLHCFKTVSEFETYAQEHLNAGD